MPAKHLVRVSKEGSFLHVYNKGIEDRNLFNNKDDYQVFLAFLEDYLSTPKAIENVKKVFSIKGRTFRGVPHQPKNYLNKVELLAYNLKPKSFHLLLLQKEHNSLPSFIRSICTRYSIYFNKKYKRTGPLFEGPYKSIQVNNNSLLLLTRYLHKGSEISSYPEYSGKRKTNWVKTEIVQSLGKARGNYKDFVEKYELNEKEKKLLERIILEVGSKHLAKSLLIPERSQPSEKTYTKKVAETPKVTPGFLAIATFIFVLLFSLGFRNVRISEAQPPTPNPEVIGVETNKPLTSTPTTTLSPTPSMKEKKTLVIKISDEAESVNIRKEPTTKSEKIGEAMEGETFEFVSKEEDWYQIKLNDGSTAFVSERYVEVQGE